MQILKILFNYFLLLLISRKDNKEKLEIFNFLIDHAKSEKIALNIFFMLKVEKEKFSTINTDSYSREQLNFYNNLSEEMMVNNLTENYSWGGIFN